MHGNVVKKRSLFLTGCMFLLVTAVTTAPVLAATTYSWSCKSGDAAGTGFTTRQGAESAAKAHRSFHNGHETVVDVVTDADLMKEIESTSLKKTPSSNKSFMISDVESSIQNNCNILLKDGVYDSVNAFGSSYAQQQLVDHMCSSNYRNYAQARADGLSLGIPIDSIMVSFGFSSDEKSFETNYSSLCTHKEMYYVANQSSSSLVRTANAKLADAFVACVAGKMFSAYIIPNDTKQFQIIAKYTPMMDGIAYAKVKSFDYDKNEITCSEIPEEGIGSTGITVNCSRKTDTKVAQLALNTTAGTQSFKVPAYVPEPPQPPITSAVGDVVMSLLDNGKFSELHRGQRWISCDQITPSNRKAPGTSWALISGNADLPLCGDRYPRAFSSGAIGQTYEDEIKSHSHQYGAKHLEARGGKGFDGAGFASNSNHGTSYERAYAVSNTGGNETRPKTVVLKFYIRVD